MLATALGCSKRCLLAGNAKATVLLQLFSAAVRPLMNILDAWLGQGQLVDPTSEFFIIPGDSRSRYA